jgi:DNA-binding MarR family transcriptional regulator
MTDRQEVAARLHSAAIHLLRRVRVADRETGLSPARLSALSVLVFGGPTTIGDLARVEGVRSPTMTAMVTQLEADGLARRRSPGSGVPDRRQVLVEATPAGVRLMRKAQQRRLELLEGLLAEAAPTVADLRLLERAVVLLEGAASATAAEWATPAAAGTPGRSTPRASRPAAGTDPGRGRGRRSS